MDGQFVAPKKPQTPARKRLVRALELFETSFDRPLRLDDLADAVRMSRSHFSRVFNDSVGEPPARYLRRYRVKRAHEMMLSTGKSLSEIALNCGFYDQSHFTRIFRRMVGVAPAAWRRVVSKGAGSTSQRVLCRSMDGLLARHDPGDTPSRRLKARLSAVSDS